jgi:hypothetical protein
MWWLHRQNAGVLRCAQNDKRRRVGVKIEALAYLEAKARSRFPAGMTNEKQRARAYA